MENKKMSTYKTFEELIVWQKAHVVVIEIYKKTTYGELAKDWALKDQIRRCASSITANIVEGHERRSPKEFSYFLNVAKASSSELRSHLIIAKDMNYIETSEYEKFKQDLMEVNRIISGFMKYLSTKQ
jgi:four helix bundle protein